MNEPPKLYGVPRSGGTLIYNVVNHIFNGSVAPQSHAYFRANHGEKTIVVYRDFRDSCVSFWRSHVLDARGGKSFDSMRAMKQIGLLDLIRCSLIYKSSVRKLNHFRKYYRSGHNLELLFLKYEDFFDSTRGDVNFNYIFNQLEVFLEIEISASVKKEIAEKYCFMSQKNESKKYRNFHGNGNVNSGWDSVRHIHAHHLLTGMPGTWKVIVPVRYHFVINLILRKELRAWGYDEI